MDTTADYFVLRLDDKGEPAHVAACRAAILTYAANMAAHIPKLAEDIRARYSTPAPSQLPKVVEAPLKSNAIGKVGDLQERPGKATEDENKTES